MKSSQFHNNLRYASLNIYFAIILICFLLLEGSIMPGLLATPKAINDQRKEILDLEVIIIVLHQVFTLGMALPVRVVDQHYFQLNKVRIPYAEFGYPDLVSYLISIQRLLVTMNSISGEYQVETIYSSTRGSHSPIAPF